MEGKTEEVAEIAVVEFGEGAVVAKRQYWWAAFSTSVDRFLKESRTFRG